MTSEEIELYKKIRSNRETIIKFGTYTYETAQSNASDSSSSAPAGSASANASYPGSAPAAMSEEDAKIAEIMNKFSSNIQNNVSSLFMNM